MLIHKAVVLLLAVAAPAAAAAGWDAPRPPGVDVRLTLEGPSFVDANGMTLYHGIGAACTGDHEASITPASGGGRNRKTPSVVELRLSCADKHPPLMASADSEPMGKWTLLDRRDGTRQWAYDGNPLHTSIKDGAPGHINGSYRMRLGSSGRHRSPVATAPMPGLPAGFTLRETAEGLVLANHQGKALYFPDPAGDGTTCGASCADDWTPLPAPAIVETGRLAEDWSIVSTDSLPRQWAHDGQPLYTYVHDSAAHGGQLWGDTFGSIWGPRIDGWRVAVVKAAPRHPAQVTVQLLPGTWEQFNTPLPTTVYADEKGLTLYTMHCRHGVTTCDDVGDDPRYWLSYCGGEERCRAIWHPLLAPPEAGGIDDVWTVTKIDPGHPFRALEEGDDGIRVWSYRGRTVFTYKHDELPGDVYGDDQSFAISGDGMQARPIAAYARRTEARMPIMVMRD